MTSQRVHYLRTSDHVQLAWNEAGSGPLLFSAGGWLTHLLYDVESPLWGHWIKFFSDHFHYVRYDERGCGMTDWKAQDLSLDKWLLDFEAVIEAANPRRPFALIGICHGVAICAAYAARHPERVSKLVLYGGYALGWERRGDPEGLRRYEAIIELVRDGWNSDNATFRRLFTSRFAPGATEAQLAWFDDHCRKVTTSANISAFLRSRGAIDTIHLLDKITVPTLIVHARDDGTVPISQSRLLASRIRNAEFLELPSRNNVLLEGEPAWKQFCDSVLAFMGVDTPSRLTANVFASLTNRERDILVSITDGLGNNAIAQRLVISDKTVRNHVSNLFDKLGVSTRAQAIVFARDNGFAEWIAGRLVRN
jgi:pimeloyl-ACP methyl ester carboxylesterase/DNA-binding CsgD family transcriptional regulator